jgi:hypothetical protein
MLVGFGPRVKLTRGDLLRPILARPWSCPGSEIDEGLYACVGGYTHRHTREGGVGSNGRSDGVRMHHESLNPQFDSQITASPLTLRLQLHSSHRFGAASSGPIPAEHPPIHQ